MMTHDHANPLERCAGFLSPALSPVLGRLGCSLPRSLSPWLVPTTFTFRIAAAPFRPSKLRLAAVTAAIFTLALMSRWRLSVMWPWTDARPDPIGNKTVRYHDL